MSKLCTKCGQIKDLSAFADNKSKSDGKQSSCRECRRIWFTTHYRDNKQYYIDSAEKRQKVLSEWWREFKSKLKCARCGFSHPAALDFHHLDDKMKEFNLATAVTSGFSKRRILREVSKCIVLCANCHRIEHDK